MNLFLHHGWERESRIDAKSEDDGCWPARLRRVLYRAGDLRLSRPRCANECGELGSSRYHTWYDNRGGSAAGHRAANDGGTIASDPGARHVCALIASLQTRAS